MTKSFLREMVNKPWNKTSYFSNTENNKDSISESYIPIEGATLTISNLSIETQTSSNQHARQSTAFDYVAAERSNLGAIQNRLTHTIDNLTNIVTNTEPRRARF